MSWKSHLSLPVANWKDMSTAAATACIWLCGAKFINYLNCNDIIQCVHVNSYLFTMINFVLACLPLCCYLTFWWTWRKCVDLFEFGILLFSILNLIKLSMASAFISMFYMFVKEHCIGNLTGFFFYFYFLNIYIKLNVEICLNSKGTRETFPGHMNRLWIMYATTVEGLNV